MAKAIKTSLKEPKKDKVDHNKRIPCPFCKELILPEAKKCRFCKENLNEKEDLTKEETSFFQKEDHTVWTI